MVFQRHNMLPKDIMEGNLSHEPMPFAAGTRTAYAEHYNEEMVPDPAFSSERDESSLPNYMPEDLQEGDVETKGPVYTPRDIPLRPIMHGHEPMPFAAGTRTAYNEHYNEEMVPDPAFSSERDESSLPDYMPEDLQEGGVETEGPVYTARDIPLRPIMHGHEPMPFAAGTRTAYAEHYNEEMVPDPAFSSERDESSLPNYMPEDLQEGGVETEGPVYTARDIPLRPIMHGHEPMPFAAGTRTAYAEHYNEEMVPDPAFSSERDESSLPDYMPEDLQEGGVETEGPVYTARDIPLRPIMHGHEPMPFAAGTRTAYAEHYNEEMVPDPAFSSERDDSSLPNYMPEDLQEGDVETKGPVYTARDIPLRPIMHGHEPMPFAAGTRTAYAEHYNEEMVPDPAFSSERDESSLPDYMPEDLQEGDVETKGPVYIPRDIPLRPIMQGGPYEFPSLPVSQSTYYYERVGVEDVRVNMEHVGGYYASSSRYTYVAEYNLRVERSLRVEAYTYRDGYGGDHSTPRSLLPYSAGNIDVSFKSTTRYSIANTSYRYGVGNMGGEYPGGHQDYSDID